MSDQKMQECFEFFYGLKWEQVNDFEQRAWKAAWMASRECLEIKLPEAKITGTWHLFGFVRGFRTAQKLMRTLYEIEINKAGVKTK